MKIIGGKFKGRVIEAPRGLLSRPPLAIIRESVFNILGQSLDGRTVLDLFAGSGSLGFESLSRGALRAHFVDASPRSVHMMERNAEALGLTASCVIVRDDAARYLRSWDGEPFDVIFIDPPFLSGKAAPAVAALATSAAVSAQTTAVIRIHRRESLDLPAPLRTFKERKFGENVVLFVNKE
jgi:16S rRNA (guanine966-N2)-methyltransferase